MTADAKNPFLISRRQLRRNLDRAAASYDNASILHAEISTRLLERLDLVKLKPKAILDAGCGTGSASAELLTRYRGARVTALDLSEAMLAQAGRKQRLFRKFQRVCGDLACLPLARDSQELVISNLALHWSDDLDQAISEFARVLRPGGLLSFSTFGPDTLGELRAAWATVDSHNHVNLFVDMHDIGDALIRAGFSDPVLDVEHVTVTYGSLDELLRDLKATGESNVTSGRPPGLITPRQLKILADAYESNRNADGLPATYEVVYGHAWAAAPRQRQTRDGETLVPMDGLRTRQLDR
jgi:malonyl-CoA O-methyltransferase